MNQEKRLIKVIKGYGHPIVTSKPDRNSKCQCGSGKKQKHCCGDDTKFYSTKPKRISPDQSEYIKKATEEKYPT